MVTGASEGIGLATSRHLTAQGAKVVLAARSADKLSQLEKELSGSLAVATDMRNSEDVKQLITTAMRHYARIDI